MVLNLQKVIHLLEMVGYITCTWPEVSSTSTWKNVLRNVRYIFALFTAIFVIVTLALGVYHYKSDFILRMKIIMEMGATLEVLCNLIIYKINNAQLQDLITRMKKYLASANKYENSVIQNHVDRYKQFYGMMVIAHIINAICFCMGPLIFNQNLPADGWIPFSTDSPAIYCIVYVIQVYCIWLVALLFVVDYMIVSFLCFIAARLDILGAKLKEVNSHELLVGCIKEHQEIIRFLDDTEAAVEGILFKMNITVGIVVVAASFPILYNRSLAVTGEFLCILVAICARMYTVSFPADDLKDSSLRFAISVNDVQWIGKPRKVTNTVLITMQRSQKPFLVSMGGFFPVLSLEYFSHFLTTISSYIMAMKAAVES